MCFLESKKEREFHAGTAIQAHEGRKQEIGIGKEEQWKEKTSPTWLYGSQICAYKLAGLKVHKVEFIVG